ncbi:MAG TPA: nitroreductase family protein [Methylophilaceae bacterium]|jgi:nitroreductase|nr:nitroreductase family protein [Methylophilaceae bacterium]
MSVPQHIQRILDLARWAPSGDNTQPWQFEILGDEHILVHGFDTRKHVVYDLDGHASQLAVGALLETLSIAASTVGRTASIQRRLDTAETHLLFDVHLQAQDNLAPHPLALYIEKRVVQRRPMSTRPLSNDQKKTLANALPAGYSVIWFEGFAQRWRLARFMFDNARIRLTIPEAYAVHKSVIEWGAQFSPDRIPEQAVGVDPLTARFMRWVMDSWERVGFFNTYLFGHVPPRLQLDLIPGLRCGAHFALLAPEPPVAVDDYIAAGRALQRFWLTATQLGWLIQPEMTPVIFTRYHRRGRAFTVTQAALEETARLNTRLEAMVGVSQVEQLFFMGRIGMMPMPWARSTRKDVAKLLVSQ